MEHSKYEYICSMFVYVDVENVSHCRTVLRWDDHTIVHKHLYTYIQTRYRIKIVHNYMYYTIHVHEPYYIYSYKNIPINNTGFFFFYLIPSSSIYPAPFYVDIDKWTHIAY